MTTTKKTQNGTQMNKKYTATVLGTVANEQHELLMVKSVNVNEKTGRCQFNFMHSNFTNIKVVVCVVCRNNRSTGVFYVIPRILVPNELLLRPGESNKWSAFCYQGPLSGLGDVIRATLGMGEATNKLIATLAAP